MTDSTKAELKIVLQEKIKQRENLREMAAGYTRRAKTICDDEIPEMDKQIRDIQADLEY